MTTVINLYGASGVGKSTTSADLFACMKKSMIDVELVREWVKRWAWQERKIGRYDQPYISAKQQKEELSLYGKVEYIVTDSPVLMGSFYEEYYGGTTLTRAMNLGFLLLTEEEYNIKRINIWLPRNKPYVQKGRYETEEQSNKIAIDMKEWLGHHIDLIELNCKDEDRVKELMKIIV
jgi:hypothetical protein